MSERYSISAPRYDVKGPAFTDGYLVEIDPGHVILDEEELIAIQSSPRHLSLLKRFGAFGVRRDRVSPFLIKDMMRKAALGDEINGRILDQLKRDQPRKAQIAIKKVLKGEGQLRKYLSSIGIELATWTQLNTSGLGASFLHCHPSQPYSSIVYDTNGIDFVAVDEEVYGQFLDGFEPIDTDFNNLGIAEHNQISRRIMRQLIDLSGQKKVDVTDRWSKLIKQEKARKPMSDKAWKAIASCGYVVGKRIHESLGDDLLNTSTDEYCSITTHGGLLHARSLLKHHERAPGKAALREHGETKRWKQKPNPKSKSKPMKPRRRQRRRSA